MSFCSISVSLYFSHFLQVVQKVQVCIFHSFINLDSLYIVIPSIDLYLRLLSTDCASCILCGSVHEENSPIVEYLFLKHNAILLDTIFSTTEL